MSQARSDMAETDLERLIRQDLEDAKVRRLAKAIAEKTELDPRTVRKALLGQTVNRSVAKLVQAARTKLE